jgi:DNA-binding response OmpR family regulator
MVVMNDDLTSAAKANVVPGPRTGRPRAPRVLLVDDDPTTRSLIAHFLHKEDFVVLKAADGGDGLARAKSDRPDLLIVDAAVPGLGGFEVLSILRRDPETRTLPVLMLSSLDEEEIIVESLDLGADYVIKPFSPSILVAKVKKILREAGERAADRRPL